MGDQPGKPHLTELTSAGVHERGVVERNPGGQQRRYRPNAVAVNHDEQLHQGAQQGQAEHVCRAPARRATAGCERSARPAKRACGLNQTQHLQPRCHFVFVPLPRAASKDGNLVTRIHTSATKHGVSDSSIRHAIRHAGISGDINSDGDKTIHIGPDPAGNLLEIIELSGLVIHAMPLRKRYEPLLRGHGEIDGT